MYPATEIPNVWFTQIETERINEQITTNEKKTKLQKSMYTYTFGHRQWEHPASEYEKKKNKISR